ncbi:hypothetical protein OQA88_2497 [Cercophora sp. LCS_1]
MRVLTLVTALLAAPVAVLGAPAAEPVDALEVRQARRQPPPCVRQNPPPSQEVLKQRFDTFVQAFVGAGSRKNITEAFEYIVDDYINHNTMAQNGAKSAWDILSGLWHSWEHRYRRSLIRENMSWVEYDAIGMTIVDRFRWEGGCIAEHVSIDPNTSWAIS